MKRKYDSNFYADSHSNTETGTNKALPRLRGWAGWGECSKELKSNYEVFLSGCPIYKTGYEAPEK